MQKVHFLLLAGLRQRRLVSLEHFVFLIDRIECHQLAALNSTRPNLLHNGVNSSISISFVSQLTEYIDEVSMFFLHLLMMAAALLCLPCADELFHGLEDLVHPPKVLVEEMVAVQLQKPMISLVFVKFPVPTFLAIFGSFSHLSLLLLFFGVGRGAGHVFKVNLQISEGSFFGHASGILCNQVTKDVITRRFPRVGLQWQVIHYGVIFEGEVLPTLVSLIHIFHYIE